MTRAARALTVCSALLLGAAFAFPLWHIRLLAPQYPEGLGLEIHVNTVRGLSPTDLANINELNHYIGMKVIDPAAIPVLHVMPWALAALALGALLVAAVGRRAALYVWLAGFAAAAAAGLWQFWRWEYDYGHDLDFEHAIIKVPGMTYQPPLIGAKQLLNFTAISWPATGGVLVGVAFLLGVAALVLTLRHRARAVRAAAPALEGSAAAAVVVLVALMASPGAARPAQAQQPIVVSPAGPVRTLTAALQLAPSGGRIVVLAGTYREPTIVVKRPVEIVGEGLPVFDGEGQREIMGISGDDVTVRGLRLINVGTSFVEDRAAIKVAGAHRCVIAGNTVENGFFGIYLAEATDCRVERNTLRAATSTEAASGNGIHLWHSEGTTIAGNRISGYRDGIYLEFSHGSDVRDNESTGNLRYGLHFMYSNDCRYSGNFFHHNGSGVAVMYSQRVSMTGNRFEENWGGAAYGLLLKEIADSRLEHNVFSRNTTGLLADGANRLVADRNDFLGNGWAVKLDASTEDARFTRNNFVANTFDMATNSRSVRATLAHNYWDGYTGYDLDGDGTGDVPYRPVRLFSLLAARNAPTLMLLRSAFVGLLDAAERALPALIPESLEDTTPAMRRWP